MDHLSQVARSLEYLTHLRAKFDTATLGGRWDDAAHYAQAISNEWNTITRTCQEHHIGKLAGGKHVD